MTGIKISVDRLQVGNYVSLPLGWREHPFLFSSFKLKNEEEIELIRRLGLKLVTIIPDKSDAPPKPLNQIQAQPVEAPDTSQRQAEMQLEKERRIEQLQQYRRDLQQCEKQFQQSLAQVRNVMSKIQSRPLNAIGEAQELINAMTEQLLSVDEMVLHLVSDSEDGNNLYFHSLNVSVLSMLLAKECCMTADEIRQVGMGALFHDIGKIREFSGGIANDYTDEGRLLGHLMLGIEMLEPFLAKSGLEEPLQRHLKHLILSHHGELEFGAVRVPHTPEAMALHYADNLDAKMAQCRGLFAQIEGEGEAWTPWQATLGRPVHRAARTPDKAAPATRKKAVKEECLSLLKV